MPIRQSDMGLLSVRSPLTALFDLRLLRPPPLIRPLPGRPSPVPAPAAPPPPPPETVDAAWQRAFETAVRHASDRLDGNFWYLRRRRIPYSGEVSGFTLRLTGAAQELDAELSERLAADGTAEAYAAATANSPLLTRTELLNVLAAPRLARSATLSEGRLAASDVLRRGALEEVRAAAASAGGSIGHDDATRIGGRYATPRLGEGLSRVLATEPRLEKPELAGVVARSLVVPQLDELSADMPDEALAAFTTEMATLAEANRPEDIAALVRR
jgi:hypothetical protein